MNQAIFIKIVAATFFLCTGLESMSQVIATLTIQIKTGDKRFAGTNDPIHFLIGGKDFNLNNPAKDDFERNNMDQFKFFNPDPEFNLELIKAVGKITISKTGDSYFGGGWNFASIKIWVNDQTEPIYANESVNKWLDGDHREWATTFGEVGWNIPEAPSFPPCTGGIILLSRTYQNDQLDSDCDGIIDSQDPTFDPNPPDDDGDGLPNRYEDQNGLKPNDPDSDDDGWLDGKNVKDVLLLQKVECLDEDGTVELGSDEIYLNIEDIRFPLSSTLDNYWEMDDNTKVEPSVIVDSRVGAGALSVAYKTRVKLRESDISIMEKPMDDDFDSFTLDWGRDETKIIDLNHDNRHYKLTFKSFTVFFMDPSPTSDSADIDNDGLKDSLEYVIATQNSSTRPGIALPVPGYNGLASPLRRDMFIEIDATSSEDQMSSDAKQQVASQFYYHNIVTRLDDGFLGGGEFLPYQQTVPYDSLLVYKDRHQWKERKYFYKYCLFVPDMGGFFTKHGRATRPGDRFMISRTTMIASFSSIVFIHELGHTLSLCHPIGTSEGPSPSPSCPTPLNWDGNSGTCFPAGKYSCCSHYCGVDQNDVTAMGSTVGIPELAIGGAVGALIALGVIALFFPGVGWIVGGILISLGGIIGAIGGFFFSDAYLRMVDYHPNEWAAIVLNLHT